MLKNVMIPANCRAEEWERIDTNDENAREWIWHQLIGETAKGDEVEFIKLTGAGDDQHLLCGVVKADSADKKCGADTHTLDEKISVAAASSFKLLIPAIYDRTVGSHYFCVDYTGETINAKIGDVNCDADFGMSEKHIDEYAREFLGSFGI